MARRRNLGLDTAAVEDLRNQLAIGKRPRVRISGPQFGDDASGTVTRIGDPKTDGPDYIMVRVIVNGMADELAFGPAEIQRGRPARSVAAPASKATAGINAVGASKAVGASERPTVALPAIAAPAGAAAAPPTVALPAIAAPAGAAAAPPAAAPPAAGPAPDPPANGAARASRKVAQGAALPDGARRPSGGSASAARRAITPSPRATAPARRRATVPPKITITIISTGATWAVSGQRGAKSVAKSAPVPPGVVTAIARLLEQPGIFEAVAEVNETAFAEAEERAAQLRSELSQVEQVLAAHRSPAGGED